MTIGFLSAQLYSASNLENLRSNIILISMEVLTSKERTFNSLMPSKIHGNMRV